MWGPFLFAIGMIAAGLYLCQLAWRYVQLRRAMRGWPRVPARVLGYRTMPGRTSFRVDVHVRYEYAGQQFEVWCRSPTRSAYGRGDGRAERQVAAKFPRGSSQQAFVNPATPQQAFLELPEPHVLVMLAGAGVALIALAFAVAAPEIFDIDQEIVVLGFMLVVGIFLAVFAGCAAIALWRAPRVRSPKHG